MALKKVFYGWWVLGAIFLVFAAVTIGVNALPLLNVELKNAFGWNHEQVTRPPSLLYFIVAIIAPIAGLLMDRFGPKAMMIYGSIVTVVALASYMFITELWQLMALYIFYASSITAGGAIAGMTIITRWFNKYRGLAVGLYLVGSSFGGIIFPQIAGYFIKNFDWQSAALALAVSAALCSFLPLLIVKNSPSAMNLRPDGLDDTQPEITTTPRKILQDIPLASALRMRTFYLILFVTAAIFLCITGVVQHLSLFLNDQQVSAEKTANVLSLFFTMSIVGKITFGRLSDHFSKKSILIVACLNMTIGSAIMLLIPGKPQWFIYLFAIVYGMGYSGAFTMVQLMVAEYFNGRSFGKILGLVTTMDTLAGSLGIFLLGNLRTSTGSYDLSVWVLIAVSAASFMVALAIRKPEDVLSKELKMEL